MNNQCRLAMRITARLPIDAVAIAYVEQTARERLDGWKPLHTVRGYATVGCASTFWPPTLGTACNN